MADILLQMMLSLDGYVAGPSDDLDWIDNDPVMGEAHYALAKGAAAAIIGHHVYQGMAEFWPQAAANLDARNNEAQFGTLMNSMRKIVVSTREEDLEWTNSEQLLASDDEDLVEKVEGLKGRTESYLLLYGGVQTAQSFIK